MKAFIVLVATIALLCGVHADPTWQVGTAEKVTSMMGLHSTAPNVVYGAVLQNGYGSGMLFSDDSAATSTLYGPMGLMNLDIAITKDGSTGCIASVPEGLLVGPAKSDQYKKVSGVHALTQDVEGYLDNGFVATGQFTQGRVSFNGVGVSQDAGASWSYFDIALNSTLYPARYAALPSENAWYVASGSWPYDSSTAKGQRLSTNLMFRFDGAKHSLQFKPLPRSTAGDDVTDSPGAISRSTDGGKTWTQVFDSKGGFYMNSISCADDTHCVAVGENGVDAYALTTSDGVNWSVSLSAPKGMSLVAAEMLSVSEAWVAGGGQVGRELTGYYYHTVDGGKSWELTTLPGYVADLSFTSPSTGFSAFLTQSYSSFAVYR